MRSVARARSCATSPIARQRAQFAQRLCVVPKTHAYVADLAQLAHERFLELTGEVDPGPCTPRSGKLPDVELLEELLSVAFQASLLREEDRPVRFRLFVGAADTLSWDVGPPEGLLRLRFEVPRRF